MRSTLVRLEVHVNESRKDAALEALRELVDDGEIRTALEGVAGTRGDDVEVTHERLEYSMCCEMMQNFASQVERTQDDVAQAKVAREFAAICRALARPPGVKKI